jgi:hypothetical protein
MGKTDEFGKDQVNESQDSDKSGRFSFDTKEFQNK